MNKIVIVLLAALVAYTSAQVLGGGVGGESVGAVNAGVEAQAIDQTQLAAGSRRQQLKDARIAKKNRRKEALAAKKARRESRRLRAQEARRARLEARRQLAAEEYAQGAEFQNVDAAVSSDSSRNFALQIIDQESSSHNAAISASSGSQFANGARLGVNEAISADQQSASDVAVSQDAASLDELQALNEQESQLAAAETLQQQEQANLQASDASASAVGANNNVVGGRQIAGGVGGLGR